VEGNLRTSGSRVRLSVKLVDTRSHTTLWAEVYERELDHQGLFALQDDLTDRVVAAVGDPFGSPGRTPTSRSPAPSWVAGRKPSRPVQLSEPISQP
jgi:hypothetical protein